MVKNADREETRPPQEGAENAPAASGSEDGFYVVGVAASAGGLDAFRQFFTHMPADSGMAFVLIQHLDPTHKSLLSELVGQFTAMAVCEAEDGIRVQPDHVYTIPPNRDMAILRGRLALMEPTKARGQRAPIDFFFRSLAQDQGSRAIGIVLSGTGTEGTLGIKAIKEAAGLVMVQDPESAEYDGMPRSAVGTGLADFVLPPAQMPERLVAFVRFPTQKPADELADYLQKVCVLLRDHTGHNFSEYKPNTLLRRINRRVALHQLDGLGNYIRLLQQDRKEAETLFRELLIAVTRFFRDPEAFASLAKNAIHPLLEGRPPELPVRVWVPGCATGEEAYSIAMVLRECMDRRIQIWPVEIFATDLDEEAISMARQGTYPETIAADVSAERLQRHFKQEQHVFRVKKRLRDWLVFAEQSLIKDPPFSRLDLISCRNLLIYLQGELQKKVLPLFHYALKPGGYLLLGNSEGVGESLELFEPIDRKWKLFRRRGQATRPKDMAFYPPSTSMKARKAATMTGSQLGYRELAERSLLEHFAAAGVLINEHGEVLYIHGRTGRYLEPAEGAAQWNVLSMARQGLRLALSAAMAQAQAKKVPVRRSQLPVKANGGTVFVDLTVQPVPETGGQGGLMLIVLEPLPGVEQGPWEEGAGEANEETPRIAALEKDLQATQEHLRTTIEELETANEELKSSNEELQSTNEELQSTNEELETAKEEQQSVNEELVTVNAELQSKVELLSRTQDDMKNLLASTEVGTVFLAPDLKVQRFTPPVTRLLNLIDGDVGRPIAHIVNNLRYPELISDAEQVLATLVPQNREAQSEDGSWYGVRIGPYRTTDNVIDGLVITFNDISEQKRVQDELRQSEARWRSLTESSPDHISLVDRQGRIQFINRTYTGLTTDQMIGTFIHEHVGEPGKESIQACLARVWETGEPGHFETEHREPDGGIRIYESQVSPVRDGGAISSLVISSRDITERKRLQKEEAARLYVQAIVDTVRDPLVVLNEDLRVQSASQSFYRFFETSADETIGEHVYDLGDQPWDISALRELLEGVLVAGTTFDDFEVEHSFERVGRRKMRLNARRLRGNEDEPQLILLAMENITEAD